MFAVKNNKYEIVKLFISQPGININCQDINNKIFHYIQNLMFLLCLTLKTFIIFDSTS